MEKITVSTFPDADFMAEKCAGRVFRYAFLILCFLLLVFASTACRPLYAESYKNKHTARINIISKQILLLKKGRIKEIALIFPPGSVMEDRHNGTFESIGRLSLINRQGRIVFLPDNRELSGKGSLSITHTDTTSSFKIIFTEEREYPMPLEVKNNGDTPEFIINEELARYVLDAAAAEYGPVLPIEYEAVNALAVIIAGRYHYNKQKPFHENYDFCDLTHCQVYKGRLGTEKVEDDLLSWLIRIKNGKERLFFHSRCGGGTFSSSVFGYSADESPGVRDWLPETGTYLCRDSNSNWERTISASELSGILFKDSETPIVIEDMVYDRKNFKVILNANKRKRPFPAEDFRLRINRVKGWNFIKSNNYAVKLLQGKNQKNICFAGQGLGHGVGLCQHGALSLARLGYSRYEIIEHYFPDAEFELFSAEGESSQKNFKNKAGDGKRYDAVNPVLTPYLSYILFDIKTGKTIKSSYKGFLYRKIPPGSIFKILSALHLAVERWDLLKDYKYNCTGQSTDENMPEKCWRPGGHGQVSFTGALSNSCNMFFASLYKHLDFKRFKSYTETLFKAIEIDAWIPDIKTSRDFSRLLSGLDFRTRISVMDLVKISQFISPVMTDNIRIEKEKRKIPFEAANMIYSSLVNTIRFGTASGELKPYGEGINYAPLINNSVNSDLSEENIHIKNNMWGKTSTVVHGTNRKVSYGVFIGGDNEKGLIVLLRKGNGHIASKWGIYLLGNQIKN